jgi:hypothetical protein
MGRRIKVQIRVLSSGAPPIKQRSGALRLRYSFESWNVTSTVEKTSSLTVPLLPDGVNSVQPSDLGQRISATSSVSSDNALFRSKIVLD